MNIILTGGSGDLGTLLTAALNARGDRVTNIDMAPPRLPVARQLTGSITDRTLVKDAMQGIDTVVHIAAWHGIHEAEKTKTPEDFHDLNVTGTFNMLEAAKTAGVKNFVFISSTSISDANSIYGNSKIVAEEICRAYAARDGLRIIILRPRAFIPSWNRAVYKKWSEWANWFLRGAVHVDDVAQAVLKSVDYLASAKPLPAPPALTIDGAYEYTTQDLENWDGLNTFEKHYAGHAPRATAAGLDITRKPRVLGSAEAEQLIGYKARYSLKTLLDELEKYGDAGPPAPF